MSFLTDLIQMASGGVASHYDKKIRNRDEEQLYQKSLKRSDAEEAKRRSRALKYDEEDYRRGFGRRLREDQVAHDIGLVREEGQYQTKRSRALNESTENRSRALKWDDEDKNKKLAIAQELAGKAPDDPNYLTRAKADIYGIEKPLTLASDGSLIGANGKAGRAGSGVDSLYKRRKLVSEEMERLMKTLQTGQGLDDFGNPSGVPLSAAQQRVLLDELTSLQGEYSSLTQTINKLGMAEGGSPLQGMVEGFSKIFADDPAQPGAATPAPAPTPAPQPAQMPPQSPALKPDANNVQTIFVDAYDAAALGVDGIKKTASGISKVPGIVTDQFSTLWNDIRQPVKTSQYEKLNAIEKLFTKFGINLIPARKRQ